MKFIEKPKLEKYINKEVISFLKKNNVYEEYIINLKDWINKKRNNYRTYIPIAIDSFDWNYTDQGYRFWNNLNNIYLSEYRTINDSRNLIRFKELKEIIK